MHLALPRRAEGCCGDGRFALGRDTQYSALSIKCADRLQLLFNGEYFIQNANWRELRSSSPRVDADSPAYPEFLELAKAEGPPYQYGSGCLSDGLLGAWFGLVCGLGDLMDLEKVESHLLAVHRNNFKRSLFRHANTKRPHFACGNEPGLLTCTWPRGGRPSLAMIYADEVWTGVEHQVASHLIARGKIQEGLEIVRACRTRYDGRVRNPFDEIEAGHWYARSMLPLRSCRRSVEHDSMQSKKFFTSNPRSEATSAAFCPLPQGLAQSV